ncbi:hypothetical protein LPJ58_001619 [Coemansia sp. RSA 1591]|nr:hypothetical protein LPJ58_001619 [Coemansia sp. RSA 1591]
MHVVAQHGDAVQPRPATDARVPANNAVLDPRVVPDGRVLHKHAALKTHAVANNHVRSNGDIGSNLAALANLGCWVYEHVAAAHVCFGCRRQQLGAALGQRRQIQACAGQKVLGLPNVHPEALQVERVQLAVRCHLREDLLLDRSRPQLDAVQDAGVEHVDAGVDAVADKLHRLLNKAVNLRGALAHDNHSVLGWLLDLCRQDCALAAVRKVEVPHVLKGILARNVGVQHKERRIVLAQDAARKGQWTGYTQKEAG